MNEEKFSKIAGGIQSLVVAVSIVVGGVWALTRFAVLVEQRIAVAQAEKTEADAKIAKNNARESIVLNVDLSAHQLKAPKNKGERWVMIELGIRNTGNKDLKIDLAQASSKFYISRVTGVAASGDQSYGERLSLMFDYPDKNLTWFILRPGAETDKMRTVQKLRESGLYIARFSVKAPDDGSLIGEGHEYSSETFFYVN
jgi:hypothetical protein